MNCLVIWARFGHRFRPPTGDHMEDTKMGWTRRKSVYPTALYSVLAIEPQVGCKNKTN